MTGLTFDWDDVSLADTKVIEGLTLLTTLFPIEQIWIRTSSSKTGMHVMIADLLWNAQTGRSQLHPVAMSVPEQMQYRHQFVEFGLECSGRLVSDTIRQTTTLQTSRVFGIKNGNRSEEWISCIEVLNT
tara:strand:+ start:85 stop:471 length:387 start_codon:yes stop_codon:yes gene_type:complete